MIKPNRLFDSVAVAGVLLLFAGPLMTLILSGSGLIAASLGYGGILIFTGAIAARYGFFQHENAFIQLLKNILIAFPFTVFFYLIFLFFYFL